jgi:hypothetical protein
MDRRGGRWKEVSEFIKGHTAKGKATFHPQDPKFILEAIIHNAQRPA